MEKLTGRERLNSIIVTKRINEIIEYINDLELKKNEKPMENEVK